MHRVRQAVCGNRSRRPQTEHWHHRCKTAGRGPHRTTPGTGLPDKLENRPRSPMVSPPRVVAAPGAAERPVTEWQEARASSSTGATWVAPASAAAAYFQVAEMVAAFGPGVAPTSEPPPDMPPSVVPPHSL